jgi:hypothetical protein
MMYLFFTNVWQNQPSLLAFLHVKVATAAAVVANDDGLMKPGGILRNRDLKPSEAGRILGNRGGAIGPSGQNSRELQQVCGLF